jgi:hypothetical protein
MKTRYLLILFALGLGLALVGGIGAASKLAIAAPALPTPPVLSKVEGSAAEGSADGTPAAKGPHAKDHIEALKAPADEDSAELAEVLHVCFGGCTYSSIQDAVDAASDGGVIKVAAGTYTGVQGRPAPAGYVGPSVITQVVYISKTVTIRGGYTTAFTDPPDPEANPTTLDARGQGRVIHITGDISPTVEGLRITGGDASGLGGGYWGWSVYRS